MTLTGSPSVPKTSVAASMTPPNQANDLTGADLEFGPFSLRNRGEALYRADALVSLGSRARQILMELIASPGTTISKAELMARVWPDTTVVDNNLTVHISALRQALADGRDGAQYIINVPGRGYRFVAPVRLRTSEGHLQPGGTQPSPPTNLPARLGPVVGLEKPIANVRAKLQSSNLVSICGPAGVGKTTLALHTARSELPRHASGVWLVDLAALSEAEHVPVAIATTLRIEAGSSNPTHALLVALANSDALFLLDNCEHLIDAVADLAAIMLRHCPDVVMLATSREALRVRGEAVYFLGPLETPPDHPAITAKEALNYPAVQLFVERLTAGANAFALAEHNAFSAARICRRLDGLPLALEFASALVGAFSLDEVAARLDDLFNLIQGDMRGAPVRHRTLNAALDWSYCLLDDGEQAALRRLAVFAGGFTLDAAAAIIGIQDLAEAGALLAKLHAKSLVTRDIASQDLRFRLLETTRAYASEKLRGEGEAAAVFRSHAVYYRDLLRQHRLQLTERDVAADAAELDNVRSALRYAMGPDGDTDLALSLTSGALPVWLGLSLISECVARLREMMALMSPEQAESTEGWDIDITLRISEMVTIGTTEHAFNGWKLAASTAPASAHTRRPDLGDVLTRWVWNLRRARATECQRLTRAYSNLVRDLQHNHFESSLAWIEGLTCFQLGEHQQAKARLQDFLDLESPQSRKLFLGRTGIDRVPGVYGALGASLCLLGEASDGLRVARLAEAAGRATTRALPLCDGKIWTHVAYEIAQVEPSELEAGLDELVGAARAQGLDSYLGFGLGLTGLLTARQNRFAAAEALLREAVDLLRFTGLEWGSAWFHGQLGLSIGRQGRVADGLKVIEAWTQKDQNPQGWSAPEFHRLVAGLHVLNGDPERANKALADSLAIASRQGAVVWRQRASADLDRLRRSHPD